MSADYKPHYIANYDEQGGLFNYLQPFLTPEKAFPTLTNMYCWRGQLLRRSGTEFLGRLRRNLTTTSIGNVSAGGAGTVTLDLFTLLSIVSTQPFAQLEPGNITTITIAIGAPISQTLTDTNGTGALDISGAGPISDATINYATGIVTLTFSGAASSSAATFAGAYYPMLPVMGFANINPPGQTVSTLIAFDTIYAYKFSAGFFNQLGPLSGMGSATWNGSDSQFFWTTQFSGTAQNPLLWATNDNSPTDPIRYWDGTNWNNFGPAIDSTNFLQQCLILVPYHGYLIALNTWEGPSGGPYVNKPQRARWDTANSDPTQSATPSTSNWNTLISDGPGFLDAATSDDIVSAGFIKDTLVVKFEGSSWKLVYTGVTIDPFYWEIVNPELGTESTFSLIPFDRGLFTVGNFGITTDDSVNVKRIDQKIPDFVFNVSNSSEDRDRVWGIRDYRRQLAYWTFVSGDSTKFPDTLLVYNYVNDSFAAFSDCFTAFGLYYSRSQYTWANPPKPTWGDAGEYTWGDGQAAFPFVVAGNQQGFVSMVQIEGPDNDPSLAITGASGTTLTVPSHTLYDEAWITITFDGVVYGPYRIADVGDQNTITLYGPPTNPALPPFPTPYIGGAVISTIMKPDARSKVFAPFYEQGNQCRIGYVDFYIDKTANGEFTCNLYINENPNNSVNDPTNANNSGLMGDNSVSTVANVNIPYQSTQQKLWKRLFLGQIGQNFQLQYTLDDTEMANAAFSIAPVTINATTLYLSPNARMTQ